MDDIERMIRAAKPAHLPSRHDALTADAEAGLAQILDSADAEPHRSHSRAWSLYRIASVAASVVVLIAVLALVRGTFDRTPVADVPQPIEVGVVAGPAAPVLLQLADGLSVVEGASEPLPFTLLSQQWSYFQRAGDNDPQDFTYEVRELRHEADGSVHLRVVEGERRSLRQRTVATAESQLDGPLVSEQVLRGDEVLLPQPPPASANALRAYFEEHLAVVPEDGARYYLTAVTALLEQWKLAPAQQRALLEVLSEVEGLEYFGETVDRQGRNGLAFVSADNPHVRVLLILSSNGDTVLGSESWRHGPVYGETEAVSLVSYTVWDRDEN